MVTRLNRLLVTLFVIAAHTNVAAALELGNATFDTLPAKPLAMSRDAGALFLRKTGGIAFGNMAEGRDGITVTGLRYDPAAADGQRLVVSLTDPDGNSRDVRGALYDWELVPVARYAADENDAAFTYFGELESSEQQETALAAGYRVLNYHPAFADTLVGLRLMQLDFLLIEALQADAMYLPKENGRTLLGNGEANFLDLGADMEADIRAYEQANVARLAAFDAAAEPIIAGQRYRSYVAGDFASESPEFFVNDSGELVFSGGIFWYFWHDPEAAALEANIDFYNQMVRLYRNLSAFETPEEQATAAEEAGSTVEELERYRDYALAAVNKSSPEIRRQADRLERLNADNERDVTPMPVVSAQLNTYLREQQGLNPLIFRAGDRVLWYSSLLRQFKAQQPAAYARFVASLDDVPVLPQVITPTLVRPAQRLN